MQWVEIINVRMADSSKHKELKHLFRNMRGQVNTGSMRAQVRLVIFKNGMVETDWSIHLHWTADHNPTGKSELGIKLAELLRPLALVDHTIWVESGRKLSNRVA